MLVSLSFPLYVRWPSKLSQGFAGITKLAYFLPSFSIYDCNLIKKEENVPVYHHARAGAFARCISRSVSRANSVSNSLSSFTSSSQRSLLNSAFLFQIF
ncbi:hypothetical protein ACET3Z_026041 [Daucus carota]